VEKELKETLQFVVPQALTKGKRRYANIIGFTGLIHLDFDHIDFADEFRDYLFSTYPFVIAAWLSASRRGVKAFVRIPKASSVDEFKAYYFGLANKVMSKYNGFDTATQNAVLPMFMSPDPSIKVRPLGDTEIWTTKGKNPKIDYNAPPPKSWLKVDYSRGSLSTIIHKIETAINRIDDNGHPQLRAAAFAAGGYVGAGYITEDQAIDLLTTLVLENDYLSKGTDGYIKTAIQMITKGAQRPLFL
jgi:hypothetical protein